ncbi:outer membrane beta-barrel protein [Chryseolinea soli]|uniref:Porin family protein n=1 Tax=Chryseolinea soli TaxID=2321403 RepID=A0A385SJC0_9BACT|nr:outer membrane beta-barrel protein [Chryseolinea soli]AYB29480.1 porin family protein [Chryseolinea soli]
MKNLFPSLTALWLCLAVSSSMAQTSKGTFLLGGSLGFSSGHSTSTYDYLSTPSKQKQSTISLAPNVSYFVIDRLSIGIVTPLSYTQYKREDIDQKTTYRSYSIGPLIRYYFPLGSHWAIFPEASYSYGWMETMGHYSINGDVFRQTFRGNARNLQGGLGLTYFLNPNIGLEGKFRYQSMRDTYNHAGLDHVDNNSFDFTIGVQVYLFRNTQ